VRAPTGGARRAFGSEQAHPLAEWRFQAGRCCGTGNLVDYYTRWQGCTSSRYVQARSVPVVRLPPVSAHICLCRATQVACTLADEACCAARLACIPNTESLLSRPVRTSKRTASPPPPPLPPAASAMALPPGPAGSAAPGAWLRPRLAAGAAAPLSTRPRLGALAASAPSTLRSAAPQRSSDEECPLHQCSS